MTVCDSGDQVIKGHCSFRLDHLLRGRQVPCREQPYGEAHWMVAGITDPILGPYGAPCPSAGPTQDCTSW